MLAINTYLCIKH